MLESRRGDAATADELYQRALEGDCRHSRPCTRSSACITATSAGRPDGVLEREAELAVDPGVASVSLLPRRAGAEPIGSARGRGGRGARARGEGERPPIRWCSRSSRALYELAGRYAELARVLERLAGAASSAAEQVGLLPADRRRSTEERLGDDDRARSSGTKGAPLDRVYLPALQALSKLYAQARGVHEARRRPRGRGRDALGSCRRAVGPRAHRRDPRARTGSARRGRCSTTARARPASRLRAVVQGARAPAHPGGRVSPSSSSSTSAPSISRPDAESKITYLFKIGRLYEDALGSPAQALAAYGGIVQVDPKELGAIHALQRAAERAKLSGPDRRARARGRRAPTRPAQVELYHRAGEVAEVDSRTTTR